MIELTADRIQRLLAEAERARDQAYAPYSKFPVGAALSCEDGSIVLGCNVENASYPLGLCAERAAVSTAVVQGHRQFVAIAVVGRGEMALTPCGGCRQVLSEFGDLWVIAAGDLAGPVRLSQLLPRAFSEANLA